MQEGVKRWPHHQGRSKDQAAGLSKGIFQGVSFVVEDTAETARVLQEEAGARLRTLNAEAAGRFKCWNVNVNVFLLLGSWWE